MIRTAPISSRKCSTRIVWSSGTTPVAARCSAMYARRFRTLASSQRYGGAERRIIERSPPPARAGAVPTRRDRSTLRVENSPCQNGIRARRAGRRDDDHPVVLDRGDPPRRGAELKDIADPRLVHELFVELPEPSAVGKVHRIEAAIGNRPAGDDRHHPAAPRPGDAPAHTVPGEPWLQLAREIGRILPGQHRQRLVEHRSREPVIRIRPPHEREERVRRGLLRRCDRDERSAPARRARSAARASARPRPRSSPPRAPRIR